MYRTKILIVDDHPENITALSGLIESDNIEILSAQNADDALSLILKHDCALALLDVQMPGTNGFELAKLIRGVKRFRNLPIIFVTAQAQDQALIFRGYETGAVDVLFKPLDAHVVRSKVRVFVQLDQQSRLLKSQMEELNGLKQKAEAANIAKTHFLANISHEIRTPLAAVMGFSDLLSEESLSGDDKKSFIEAIQRNGKLLLRLIDDVLDISKIEAQKMDLDQTEVDLHEILNDVKAALAPKAAAKKIDLQFELSPDLHKSFISDSLRIKQILLNILSNAIKFTNAGRVKLLGTSELVSDPSYSFKKYRISFKVSDTGIGLSKEQASRLFQPFTQADSSTRRVFGGTGLGLVISKQLAQAAGGDVVLLESSPNMGSTFEITLMLKEAKLGNAPYGEKFQPGEPAPASAPGKTISKSKNILIVDDADDNRVLIKMFLKDLDSSLDIVSDARTALKNMKSKAYDLVLMDIQMPGMDGHEATQAIRKSGYNKPVIALTAHAMKSELDKCKSSGFDHVITKPINRKELLDTLSRYLTTP